MKKIIIVNNNMNVGGVQKSLCNLLHTIHNDYDITLLLFSKRGAYVDCLPDRVKVIECQSLFRYLGMSQNECLTKKDAIKRGILAAMARVFGRKYAIRWMLTSQKMVSDSYDCAIAFLHNGNPKSFYGGVQDFVLHRVEAKRKVAFLHCDYRNCGSNHKDNHRLIAKFDAIAACSDGCRQSFETVLPHLKDKCMTVRNCHRFDEIRRMAEENPVCYDKSKQNVVVVSRLAHEKGIERAICAAAYAMQKGISMHLHIVGDGAMREELQKLVCEMKIEPFVSFYGEQRNPYRFLKNADLLLLTSYHEAAPMVLDEARILGIPVLCTRTTSSEDMVLKKQSGFVCENHQDAINEMLISVLTLSDTLCSLSERLKSDATHINNAEAIDSFKRLFE